MCIESSRPYRLRERARKLEQTRRRIVEATVALHLEVGPAATEVAEIARRAGVQRRTIYNHFPDQGALLGACSAHWRSLHPAPDPSSWGDVGLRRALEELYAWYRETEPMTAHVLRDAEGMPSLAAIIDRGLGAYMQGVEHLLVEGLHVRAARRRRRAAVAVRAAIDFHLWRALSPLGDREAAALAAGMVALALQH